MIRSNIETGFRKRFGWNRQLPDPRDYVRKLRFITKVYPDLVDLRPQCSPVYDQNTINAGSCTGCALACNVQYDRIKQGLPDFVPSRLFIYYNEREIEGTVDYDAGANLRDGIKSIANQGVCPEDEWPYIFENLTKKPSDQCYTDALKYKAVRYEAVPQIRMHFKNTLCSGYLIVGGISVFENFPMESSTGDIPMPLPDSGILGGHAIVIVGYDDRIRKFIIRNSWGDKWGDKGYGYIPYEYILNHDMASDFWTMQLFMN